MRFISTALCLALIAAVANAATPSVPYQFSGTVTAVSSPLASGFHVGEIISGHMDLTFAESDFELAYYNITNFAANIGGNYPLTGVGTVRVLNDFGGSLDLVGLDMTSQTDGLTAAAVAGHKPDYFSFNLLYPSLSTLASVNLIPQFVIDSPLDRSNLRFDGNDSIEVQFQLADFSAVPEPSTIALLGLGGTVCLMARRKTAGR